MTGEKNEMFVVRLMKFVELPQDPEGYTPDVSTLCFYRDIRLRFRPQEGDVVKLGPAALQNAEEPPNARRLIKLTPLVFVDKTAPYQLSYESPSFSSKHQDKEPESSVMNPRDLKPDPFLDFRDYDAFVDMGCMENLWGRELHDALLARGWRYVKVIPDSWRGHKPFPEGAELRFFESCEGAEH